MHAEIPENDHWDQGALKLTALLAQAQAMAPRLNPGHGEKPPLAPSQRLYAVTAWKAGSPVVRIRSAAPGASVGRLVARGYTTVNTRKVNR